MGSKTNIKIRNKKISMIINFDNFLNENVNKKKILYHGSRYLFNKFSDEKLGSDEHLLSYMGYHFTPDKKTAKIFARKPEHAIYTVEIIFNKTLKIKESDLVRNILRWGYDNKYFSLPTKSYVIDWIPPWLRSIDDLLSLPYHNHHKQSIMDELVDDKLLSIPHKKLALGYKKYLMKQGYDSIKYLNEIEFDGFEPVRYDWIVFHPKQIKIINIFQ